MTIPIRRGVVIIPCNKCWLHPKVKLVDPKITNHCNINHSLITVSPAHSSPPVLSTHLVLADPGTSRPTYCVGQVLPTPHGREVARLLSEHAPRYFPLYKHRVAFIEPETPCLDVLEGRL